MKSITVRHSSSIFIGEYPDVDALKEELVPHLEKWPDDQGKETNVKATMTPWNILSPQIDKLKQYIIGEVEEILPPNLKSLSIEWIDFWGCIYRQDEYAIPHDHVPSYLSLVYFLKSEEVYSPLVFTEDGREVTPKEGRFVIFPGYLKHHVPKHRYNNTRMTLSGNIMVRKK